MFIKYILFTKNKQTVSLNQLKQLAQEALMKSLTKLSTVLISLFLVSCITESNYKDDFDNDLDIHTKIHEAIYNELSEIFGKEPIIVGEVTGFEIGDEILRLLIEEDPEVTSPTEIGGKKMWFTINKETQVFMKNESNIIRVDELNIELGQIVGGWVKDGDVIAESYPSQATSNRVISMDL